jgi:hypothetical protein
MTSSVTFLDNLLHVILSGVSGVGRGVNPAEKMPEQPEVAPAKDLPVN